MPAINVRRGFPQYTAAEVAADRVLHLLALPAAIGAAGWLFVATIPTISVRQVVAQAVYSGGLIGMLTASTIYNISRASPRRELLRRIDHAMIFVMIAGTYTPFTLIALQRSGGPLLCALIWSVALIGIIVKLALPRRFERLLLALYLTMGWMALGMGRSLMLHLSNPVLFLLLAGGAAYSCGAFIHAQGRLPFHNVIWHALVVLGASLHWVAVGSMFGWQGIVPGSPAE